MARIIWKDRHAKKQVFVCVWAGFCILGLAFSADIAEFLVRLLIVGAIPLPLFLITVFNQLTYIREDGIRIGNAKDGQYYWIRSRRAKFIPWEQIQKIKLYKKGINYPLSRNHESFISVKMKDGRQYESFVARPEGFLKALKHMKKEKLVHVVRR